MVRVQGPEREVLRREAEKVAKMLSGIPGLVNARVERPVETPQIEIKVDLAAAGRVGLKPGDVRRAAATVFAGLEVGNLYEQQKVFEVVVWGAPESRQSLTNVRELLIDTPDDGHVRLGGRRRGARRADAGGHRARGRLAPHRHPRRRRGAQRGRHREGGQGAAAEGRVSAGIPRRVARRRTRSSRLPAGGRSSRALAAAIGIYLLLQACFQSWRLASLLFLSLVAALVGRRAGDACGRRHRVARLSCRVPRGAGIAVRSGILLINRYQRLEREEGEAFGPGACPARRARAARADPDERDGGWRRRLARAWLLGDIAGLEILHPMAVVILGGLVVSAIMSLFVIPALYLRFASPQPQPDDAGRRWE